MGVDFLGRTKKTFHKSWDQARSRLFTSDLFLQIPDCAGHSAVFDLMGELNVKQGDLVTVEKVGGILVARHCLREVGRAANPPVEILKAVEDSCGVAKGTIHQIYAGAAVAEISLC
jgi:hypothetical protein